MVGYNDKMTDLLDIVLDKMFNFTVDEKRFLALKENVSNFYY